VGIPRVLFYFERLPFWQTYFQSLGFNIVFSKPTRKDIVNRGLEAAASEPCFPIQVAHGHLMDLTDQADWILLPNVTNEEDPTASIDSFICPWTQTVPLVVKHTKPLKHLQSKLWYPNIQFREGLDFVCRQLKRAVAPLGINGRENRNAVQMAYKAQGQFVCSIQHTGKAVLTEILGKRSPVVVLLGRPYNLYDSGLNLNIPGKLRSLYGVDVIPMNFLPLNDVDIRPVHNHMFWNYGRKILQAARFTRDFDHLHLIYISNFKCGPDSYVRHYIQEAACKSFLFLQLDAHANDAGIMTRIEAFLESHGIA
jgi:predicted nucleotide-binding protein (sugar kinase/HSP70/actin superfamily)